MTILPGDGSSGLQCQQEGEGMRLFPSMPVAVVVSVPRAGPLLLTTCLAGPRESPCYRWGNRGLSRLMDTLDHTGGPWRSVDLHPGVQLGREQVQMAGKVSPRCHTHRAASRRAGDLLPGCLELPTSCTQGQSWVPASRSDCGGWGEAPRPLLCPSGLLCFIPKSCPSPPCLPLKRFTSSPCTLQ